jgi:hypothetical protein
MREQTCFMPKSAQSWAKRKGDQDMEHRRRPGRTKAGTPIGGSPPGATSDESLKTEAIADDAKRAERAERIREAIAEVISRPPGKPLPIDPAFEQPQPSPRDFIHRRMKEVDDKFLIQS